MAAISAKNLVKKYPGASQPALNKIDLTINTGEVFGLLGPNGAGKTTALSILSGLLTPDSGQVTIDGRVPGRDPDDPRSMIGLVPQDIALYPTLTVYENLEYFGRMHGLTGARLGERIDVCLGMGSLTSHANRRVGELSGGMKRRANLAVGLIHEPRILLLDEPTVGVDAQSRGAILDAVEELVKGDLTVIYTTHYMEEAERLCDRVAIMDDGQILQCGRPTDLVTSAECKNLEDLFLKLTGRALRDE